MFATVKFTLSYLFIYLWVKYDKKLPEADPHTNFPENHDKLPLLLPPPPPPLKKKLGEYHFLLSKGIEGFPFLLNTV